METYDASFVFSIAIRSRLKAYGIRAVMRQEETSTVEEGERHNVEIHPEGSGFEPPFIHTPGGSPLLVKNHQKSLKIVCSTGENR